MTYRRPTPQEINDAIEANMKRIQENIAAHESCVITFPQGLTIGGNCFGEEIPTFCDHEFVNVSFAHIKMVCKHCNAEQL